MRQPPAEGHDLAVGTDAERRRPEAPLGGDVWRTREASLPAVAISGDTKSRDRPKRGARGDQPEPSGAAPEALGSGNESELCGPRAAPPGCGPRLYPAGVDTAPAASGRTPCAGTWAAGVGRRAPGGGRARRLDPRTWAVRAMPTPPVRPTTGREGHGELLQPPGRTPSAGGRPCGSPGLPRSLGATRSARITVNTQRRHPPKAGGANAGREPEQRVWTPHGQRGLTCLPAPSPSSGTR